MPWRCSCGYSEEAKAVFLNHFRHNKGNGDHKSLGWLDPTTGEVRTVPPSKLKDTPPKAQKETPRPAVASSTRPTTALAEAQTITIYPKQFTMSSVLLWQAREAAIRELGWPELPPEDFLDTWLYYSFKNLKGRSIILGAYQVVVKEGGNGSEGHSQ